jgi:cytochrome P450
MFKRVGKPENIINICYPWIHKLFPSFLERDKTLTLNHDIMHLMWESIREHKETLDPNEPRDFTDKVLIEIQETTDKTSSFYGELGLENLANTLFDLFGAGSETTSTTLTWAALYMIRYQDIQSKVQEELDRVVGTETEPSMTDRPNLPYTEVFSIILSIR